MKWTYPQHFDSRTRKVFAWTPISHAGTSYWLERLTICETYSHMTQHMHGRWEINWIVQGWTKEAVAEARTPR